MTTQPDFFDEAALLERLTNGLRDPLRPVIFLFGSAITAPTNPGSLGVPNVSSIVQMIRDEFDPAQLGILESILSKSDNIYQTAFSFLVGRRGQQAANDIVRKAVWHARIPIRSSTGPTSYTLSSNTADEACKTLDADIVGWVLPSATEAIGHLISEYPRQFGSTILTTNFDPLITVSIARAGGHSFRTVLHGDGNLTQTQAPGCHVVHLHGYWYGSDTLHTPSQLNHSRPRLRASLTTLIRGSTLLVCGYGGWDDAITSVLAALVQDDSAFPEIIWMAHKRDNLRPSLLESLQPGIARGRVSIYTDIDAHVFFARLLEAWRKIEPHEIQHEDTAKQFRHQVTLAPGPQLDTQQIPLRAGDLADHPPHVEICVGRDHELRILQSSPAPVFFITGIGGEGKSTLAAKYFTEAHDAHLYDIVVWRDCKEESARFESQIASVVGRLLNGRISYEELSLKPIDELARLLVL